MAISKKQLVQAATDSMFTETPTKSAKAGQTHGTGKAQAPTRTERVKAGEAKKETATFSVKVEAEVLKRWRIYASMNGYGDKGKLTNEALREYMANHPLTKEQESKIKAFMEI